MDQSKENEFVCLACCGSVSNVSVHFNCGAGQVQCVTFLECSFSTAVIKLF
jgi:hypothetical protein